MSESIHGMFSLLGVARAETKVKVFSAVGTEALAVVLAKHLYRLNCQSVLADCFTQIKHLPTIDDKTILIVCHVQPRARIGVNRG
jgi:hypothetical protein